MSGSDHNSRSASARPVARVRAREDDVVWRPDPGRVEDAELTRFTRWLQATGRTGGVALPSYDDLWRWSVRDLDGFWRGLATYLGIEVGTPAGESVAPDVMPGGRWFPGTTLNYAEVALSPDRSGEALVAVAEDGTRRTTTWAELRQQVAAVAGFLKDQGVQQGDRVVAVLPNRSEAVVGLLAAASIGAVWSIVAPEFGGGAVLARLRQLKPVVLIAGTGYRYGGKDIDRSEMLAEVLGQLPSLRHVIWVDRPPRPPVAVGAEAHHWDGVVAQDRDWSADPQPFEHPLWVLFSSGTTGVPKGIVHGHGGVVLEHLKSLALHADLRPGQTLFVVGSTSWVVWTMLVSGLLRGVRIVLLDGNPAYPDPGRVWQVAADERATVLGLGAAYVHAGMRTGLTPGRDHDLSALRILQVTGSPLSPDAYRWVMDAVGNVCLASVSGGTDVAGIFLGGVPTEPVRLGRLQPPALGVAAAAWDADGQPIVGHAGELVITKPMPSMPLFFWHDPDGSRYRESYFSMWPGVWRHGDLVEFDADGTSVILGRSDSTLNRNGIRLGPADIYRVVEALPEVREALIVGVERGTDYYMPLFVQLVEGVDPAGAVEAIRGAIRSQLSPRYLPDDVIPVAAVPHTRTGKKLEVPVKRLLQGGALDEVVDPGSVDDISALAAIRDAARRPT